MIFPVAILTADWHIWHRAPIYRSEEENWFEAQERALNQIKEYQYEHPDVPCLVAGDIFDYYNPNPETVNWLMEHLPRNVIAIPGQHDLQNHSTANIERTGFWTLVASGKIRYSNPYKYEIGGMTVSVRSKEWGQENPKDIIQDKDADIRIFMAHEYAYIDEKTSYNGVEKEPINLKDEFYKQFDIIQFGDNHIPFCWAKASGGLIVNCGTLNIRKVSEKDYEPSFWIVMNDKSVRRIKIDTSFDEYGTVALTKNNRDEESELFLELDDAGKSDVDFREELERYLKDNKFETESKNIVSNIFTEFEKRAK